MLENENDDLHEQLALGDERVDVLEQETEKLRADLGNAQEVVSRQESEQRINAKELSTLKVNNYIFLKQCY
jgi:cell division inhibitor SulA